MGSGLQHCVAEGAIPGIAFGVRHQKALPTGEAGILAHVIPALPGLVVGDTGAPDHHKIVMLAAHNILGLHATPPQARPFTTPGANVCLTELNSADALAFLCHLVSSHHEPVDEARVLVYHQWCRYVKRWPDGMHGVWRATFRGSSHLLVRSVACPRKVCYNKSPPWASGSEPPHPEGNLHPKEGPG
jgi:hypothetical protein